MKNLKFEELEYITELTQDEASQIDGGEGFWYDVSYVLGVIAHGVVVFATEGGNNAGLVVK